MEREWQMMRLAPGDYLLPSNDRRVVWRITRYHEDGSAESGGQVLVGDFWQAARRPYGALRNLLDWGEWEVWEQLLPTRKAAIESAMKADEHRMAAEG